jgi:competence protein ComEA
MPPAPESLPATVQPERVGLLDVNAAGAGELEQLPGIGPRLAARIIALRSERGGFSRVEELLAVRGIGPATLARIAPALCVGPRAVPGRPAGVGPVSGSFRDTSVTHSGEVLR